MEATARDVIPLPDPKPHFEVVTITPEIAGNLLSRNTQNRPLSEARVQKYAREMTEGRWLMNGEPILFDRHGKLINGQHRLYACIRSGVSFECVVGQGLGDDVFPTLDQHGKRTIADVLSIDGEASGHVLAAAVTRIWKYERGILTRTGMDSRPSTQEARETLARHPGIRESMPHGAKMGNLVSRSLMTFCHYIFSAKNPELAEWFMEALGSGADIGKTDPVFHLRRRLIEDRAGKARLPEKEVIALTFKTWNATRAGREVRALRWRGTGPTAEPFPKVM